MAKNRWSYSVCNLTSQRILSGCVCVCDCVYADTFGICAKRLCVRGRVCARVCVRCWVKPLIEKQATVATCLTVSPGICLEQHEACVRAGGREGEKTKPPQRGGFPSILLPLSPFSLFGRQCWSWKRPLSSLCLPPSLVTVWVFLSSIICESAPGHITTRRALLWV